MRKTLFITVALAFTLFCNATLAELPDAIFKYINQGGMPTIARNLSPLYSREQVDLILENVKITLEKKFASLISKTSTYNSNELSKDLNFNVKDFVDINQVKDIIAMPQIQSLITRYDGKIVGNILNIRYHGHLIPLTISAMAGDVIVLKLNGLPMTTISNNSCLILDVKEKKPSAKIAWLSSMNTACPIPSDSRGNFLLSLGEEVSEAMGVKTVTLDDESEVQCPKNGASIDFRLLKLLQSGKSWYESKGYVIKDRVFEEAYHSQVKDFINYPLERLQHELGDADKMARLEIKMIDNLQEVVNLAQQKIASYLDKKPQAKFSEFMAALYEEDCAIYTQLSRLFLSEFKPQRIFTIETLIPINLEMIKFLK